MRISPFSRLCALLQEWARVGGSIHGQADACLPVPLERRASLDAHGTVAGRARDFSVPAGSLTVHGDGSSETFNDRQASSSEKRCIGVQPNGYGDDTPDVRCWTFTQVHVDRGMCLLGCGSPDFCSQVEQYDITAPVFSRDGAGAAFCRSGRSLCPPSFPGSMNRSVNSPLRVALARSISSNSSSSGIGNTGPDTIAIGGTR
jgi:hypothetical protein